MRVCAVFGLAMIVVAGASLLWQEDLKAASDDYPCIGTYGQPGILCGPNKNVAPGACFHHVGSGTCSETATFTCSNVTDYWCHSHDVCTTTSNPDADCLVASYPGETYLWYFDCPESAASGAGACTCVRYTDFEDDKDLSWNEFDVDSTTCD